MPKTWQLLEGLIICRPSIWLGLPQYVWINLLQRPTPPVVIYCEKGKHRWHIYFHCWWNRTTHTHTGVWPTQRILSSHLQIPVYQFYYWIIFKILIRPCMRRQNHENAISLKYSEMLSSAQHHCEMNNNLNRFIINWKQKI